ncbi:MAG TPA: inositol-3-phosphate synthase [Elusimicrobia bacterium]|nr:MAG: inositol-3-phosphate synthase [Elusimicrobia bacterium GWA2_66_18]OGR76103.1 MAG: inositol-3-phosphate synthase [Elusimicrobia bacterium GWC2_65_9]HAZ09342.1 inositol-3-phosphate synthase [Elusimicrobiota bacterium]
MKKHDSRIPPAKGKLGVLLPGMGAVSSTFIAGVELAKKGLGKPIGSLTQLQAIRLGKRYENRSPLIKDFVPLASLSQLVFGGWDFYTDDMFVAATKAGVLNAAQLAPVRNELSAIKPMSAIYDPTYIKNIKATSPKRGKTKWDLAQQVMADIENFKKKNGCDRVVMLWCGSTEILPERTVVHENLEAFEKGLEDNAPEIPPSMIYAYAALKLGMAYANGAPNLSADIPALVDLAERSGSPLCGKDFKTGQTLIKTTLAPMFKARMLALTGWYSTNILGNRDGEVLDDPGSFKTKEKSKMSVLDTILEPELYPDLYGKYHHKVRIDYYPPRGDAKEGWDNIDIRGWLDMPMQIKVNFLCRDSILAAPICLDLVLFLDLAKRAGLKGIQEWLSFYFKSPQCREDLKPEHDIFIQHLKLKNTLRILMGEEVLDHSGLDYYDPTRGAASPAPVPKPAAKKKSLAKTGR